MNRHFQAYNALPCEPLGTPIRREAEKPSPETPWKPVPGHPDYRERINAQGIREVSHKEHVPAPVVTVIAAGPVQAAWTRQLSAEELASFRANPYQVYEQPAAPAATEVPEGATHRLGNCFYRAVGGWVEYWDGYNGEWSKTANDLHESLLDDPTFKRLLQTAAPTEWQSGPPPERGWREVLCSIRRNSGSMFMFWSGTRYTTLKGHHDSMEVNLVLCFPEPRDGQTWCKPDGEEHALWRGPRLTGEAWPEPQS